MPRRIPRFKILPAPAAPPKTRTRMTHLEAIARETGISLSSVTTTAKLLAEGQITTIRDLAP